MSLLSGTEIRGPRVESYFRIGTVEKKGEASRDMVEIGVVAYCDIYGAEGEREFRCSFGIECFPNDVELVKEIVGRLRYLRNLGEAWITAARAVKT